MQLSMNVAAVQREVQDQEQAAENANCLIDSHCESMELCDTCEVGSIDAADYRVH